MMSAWNCCNVYFQQKVGDLRQIWEPHSDRHRSCSHKYCGRYKQIWDKGIGRVAQNADHSIPISGRTLVGDLIDWVVDHWVYPRQKWVGQLSRQFKYLDSLRLIYHNLIKPDLVKWMFLDHLKNHYRFVVQEWENIKIRRAPTLVMEKNRTTKQM